VEDVLENFFSNHSGPCLRSKCMISFHVVLERTVELSLQYSTVTQLRICEKMEVADQFSFKPLEIRKLCSFGLWVFFIFFVCLFKVDRISSLTLK